MAGGRTKEEARGERAGKGEGGAERGRERQRAGAGKTSGRRCRWRDTCSSREPATAARAVTQLATTIHIRPTSPNVAFFLDITSLSPPTPPRSVHSAPSTHPPRSSHHRRLQTPRSSRLAFSGSPHPHPLLGTALGLVGITAPPQQLAPSFSSHRRAFHAHYASTRYPD